MRILVDADACPVRRLIVEAAKARGIPIVTGKCVLGGNARTLI